MAEREDEAKTGASSRITLRIRTIPPLRSLSQSETVHHVATYNTQGIGKTAPHTFTPLTVIR